MGDDLSRTSGIVEYYQTQPDIVRKSSPGPESGARRSTMAQPDFLFASADRRHVHCGAGWQADRLDPRRAARNRGTILLATSGAKRASRNERLRLSRSPALSDKRMTTDIVGSVRNPDGTVIGYLGVSVLVERMGRRLSSIEFADQSIRQVIDQNGAALFTNDFQAKHRPRFRRKQSPSSTKYVKSKPGIWNDMNNLYSFSPIETTGWVAVVEQPQAAAYKPVRDLLGKITFLAVWLIVLTAIGAWLAGSFTRRQREATRRIEREVIFNEKSWPICRAASRWSIPSRGISCRRMTPSPTWRGILAGWPREETFTPRPTTK